MTPFSREDLAAWAERKRVRAHLTGDRADPNKCTCAGLNCLAAQAAADHFRSVSEPAR